MQNPEVGADLRRISGMGFLEFAHYLSPVPAGGGPKITTGDQTFYGRSKYIKMPGDAEK